jgi:hypothetical protein
MSGYFIQSRFGTQGNFEVVAPSSSGGLAHYWRNNDDPRFPWNGPFPFGGSLGNIDGVSLIQSNFGDPGNLEVIAIARGQAYHFVRDSGPSFTWNGPDSGVAGVPGLIQSRFGTQGNFEVVVPSSSGGLAHYWRNNDDPTFPWNGPFPFARALRFGSASLIQSNFGDPGNLEVVAGATSQEILAFSRDSGPSFTWSGPVIVATGI